MVGAPDQHRRALASVKLVLALIDSAQADELERIRARGRRQRATALRNAIDEHGVTREELAAELGVSARRVRQILAG